MPVDVVLMRDSCGKSRSQIKKYFYYNEYATDKFPFTSDFEELTLLDLIEGKKSFADAIPLFVPSFILLILALGCIGVWISICVCSVKPKCFCKKDNKNTNRTRFICLMVFFAFALCIIVLAIVLLVYINNAEYDFNGTICSLLMFQFQIINGQGILSKEPIYKPYWYGSNGIAEAITDINTFLLDLKTSCEENVDAFQQAYVDASIAEGLLNFSLTSIYDLNKDAEIAATSPGSAKTRTFPKYIKNLGPITNNETYVGKIMENYDKNFRYIKDDILLPVTGLCTVLSGDGGQYLTNGLEGFESVIDDLNSMLDDLSSKITEYITKYADLIINLGYKVNFVLFILIIIVIIFQIVSYIVYYYHPFALLKNILYIVIHILNFILILCIIYNAIFSVLAMIMGNMADIVDAILSKENLSAQSPRLINGNGEINKLTRCLRGDGDLFDEFVTEDVKTIVDPLTTLYELYTPVKTVNNRINNQTAKNEYNSLLAIDNIIDELENMKEDFVLSTTKEISQDDDISTVLDELNKYTMAGRRYQQQCITATYDIWTTNSEHCTQVQADVNIITGQCRYLNDFYTRSNHEIGARSAEDLYKTACSLINTNFFPDVKTAVYNYILFFSDYRDKNEALINQILEDRTITIGTETNTLQGFKSIRDTFKEKFIDKMKTVMPIINREITGEVYNLFRGLLNDTTTDTSKLSEDFNLFSWMNCSAIGQDYNVTLSTLKFYLTEEMRTITYCSLACELLLICVLYIMLGLNKNLRDKIFEINDDRNVSHSSDNVEEMEIDSNTNRRSEKNSDEIYNAKNKKNFQVVNDIDRRRGIDVKDKSNLDKKGKGIEHPVMVSINGPNDKPLFENGENGENIHKKMNKSKKYYKTNKDTEEELTSSQGEKTTSKVKSKNKTTTNGESNDNEEEEEDEEENEGTGENTNKNTNKKTNKTKGTQGKSKKLSLNKKTNKKEESEGSSSVSFG